MKPPHRISQLPSLQKCDAQSVFQASAPYVEKPAANTGSAVGRLIELYHRAEYARLRDGTDYTGVGLFERVDAEKATAFPLADMDQVLKLGLAYCNDSRNVTAISAHDDGVLVDSLEKEVVLVLQPHEDDPTGEAITLVGHTDQIRRMHGQLAVWDVKAGQYPKDARLFPAAYGYQLCAYAEAASASYGEPVLVGGIIRLRGYVWSSRCKWDRDDFSAAPSVHIGTGWHPRDVRKALGVVAHKIALLRGGIAQATPGEHCRYCESDFPACIDELARMRLTQD